MNSKVPDVFVLTASFHVDLFRPVTGGTITAHGKLIHASSRLFHAESTLRDDAGRLIARGSGTFLRSKIRLDERIGYR